MSDQSLKEELTKSARLAHRAVTRNNAMHELGIGTMRSMKSVFKDIFVPVWTCRAYTLSKF